jgi:hypothetical protein
VCISFGIEGNSGMSSFASAIIEKSVSDRLKNSMSVSAVDFLLREYPGSQDHRQNPDRQVGIFVAVPTGMKPV